MDLTERAMYVGHAVIEKCTHTTQDIAWPKDQTPARVRPSQSLKDEEEEIRQRRRGH